MDDAEYPLALAASWPLVCTSLSWFLVVRLGVHLYCQTGDRLLLWLAGTVFSTATFSVIHWADARYGPRRYADMVMATVSLIFFTIVAGLRIRDKWIALFGWPIWAIMALFYRKSIEAYRQKQARWITYHAAFHICVGSGQALIMFGTALTS